MHALWMIIYGVWARIASYVSPKSCKFSPKCGKRRAVSLIFEIPILPRLILQGSHLIMKKHARGKDHERVSYLMREL